MRMQTVGFPGLGLSFQINSVAFVLGHTQVYWYGIIIAFGMMTAIYYCGHIAPRFGYTASELYNMTLLDIPLSIIGARIYYVLFNIKNYINASGEMMWKEAINIKSGGLAIYGGIITSIIVLAIWCKIRHYNFPAFADLGLIGMIIGQIIGRFGNFMNIEAYGYETTLPWRMRIPYTNELGYIEVHPTFLYEVIWNIIGLTILLIIVYKNKRKFDGQIMLSYIAWYGFGRAIIESFRSDSLYVANTNIRISQVVGIITFICSVSILFIKYKQTLKDKEYKDKLYINTRYSNK